MATARRLSTAAISTAKNKTFYDMIIVGGGMIGSALASALANNPLTADISILLLENGKTKEWNADLPYSNRVSALNVGTKKFLQSIGVWNRIPSIRCKPVKHMTVWGNGSNQLATTFDSNVDSNSGDDLAYIVENDALINSTFKSLADLDDRVEVLYESSVVDFKLPASNNKEPVQVMLRDGSAYQCNLLVGADGVNSNVRKQTGIQYLAWNYNQRAVVATLELSQVDQNYTAWQKFLSTGPLALLPLNDTLSSLVWSTTPEHSKTLLALSDESFVDALNTSLWEQPCSQNIVVDNISDLIGFSRTEFSTQIMPPTIKSILPGSRASFPLGFGHATRYVTNRVALVGDSAHRIHPLAGQGVNLGFGDVKCLTDMLAKHISCGGEIGDMLPLWDYETLRQRANVPKMIAVDIIHRVAGQTWAPIMLLTNAGFKITNSFSVLKKFLVNQATAI